MDIDMRGGKEKDLTGKYNGIKGTCEEVTVVARGDKNDDRRKAKKAFERGSSTPFMNKKTVRRADREKGGVVGLPAVSRARTRDMVVNGKRSQKTNTASGYSFEASQRGGVQVREEKRGPKGVQVFRPILARAKRKLSGKKGGDKGRGLDWLEFQQVLPGGATHD